LSFPYPSKRLIAPQIPRPAPSATTSVCKVPTALVKNVIIKFLLKIKCPVSVLHRFSLYDVNILRPESGAVISSAGTPAEASGYARIFSLKSGNL